MEDSTPDRSRTIRQESEHLRDFFEEKLPLKVFNSR